MVLQRTELEAGKALLVSFSKNKAVALSELESPRAPVLEVSSSSLWFASSSMVENGDMGRMVGWALAYLLQYGLAGSPAAASRVGSYGANSLMFA